MQCMNYCSPSSSGMRVLQCSAPAPATQQHLAALAHSPQKIHSRTNFSAPPQVSSFRQADMHKTEASSTWQANGNKPEANIENAGQVETSIFKQATNAFSLMFAGAYQHHEQHSNSLPATQATTEARCSRGFAGPSWRDTSSPASQQTSATESEAQSKLEAVGPGPSRDSQSPKGHYHEARHLCHRCRHATAKRHLPPSPAFKSTTPRRARSCQVTNLQTCHHNRRPCCQLESNTLAS